MLLTVDGRDLGGRFLFKRIVAEEARSRLSWLYLGLSGRKIAAIRAPKCTCNFRI